MNSINKVVDVNKIIVKSIYVDSNNNLVSIRKYYVKLENNNILSTNEQKDIIQRLKKNELPNKCVCSGILESQVDFVSNGGIRKFDFDEIELTNDDLNSLENDEQCTKLNTYEHKQLKNIYFKPTPLMLIDLNEIIIILREVTNTQIKTRKNRMKMNEKSQNKNDKKMRARRTTHKHRA
jgi:hypothetical protein